MNYTNILNLFLSGENFIEEICSQLKKFYNTKQICLLDVNLILVNYVCIYESDPPFAIDSKKIFNTNSYPNYIKIFDNNEMYVFVIPNQQSLFPTTRNRNSLDSINSISRQSTSPEIHSRVDTTNSIVNNAANSIVNNTTNSIVNKRNSVETINSVIGNLSPITNNINTVICRDIDEFVKLITPLMYNYRQKNKQVSLGTTLMSNISHEIRTPLNGIITTGKLLSETPLNEMQKDYMNIITSSCVQLLGLVNDILDISKLENNKLVLNITSFSLRELIEECMEMTRDKIYDKNLDINLFIDIKHDIIMNDKRRLMQIIINLIYNAIKFTEKGNIIIQVDVIDEKILINVSDTGIGISDFDKYKLFKPFTQLDSSSSKNYEGTGLGLAISKMLANKMNGDLILLQSEIQKGSTFQLQIPYRKGIIENSYEDYSLLHGKKCLVVDDNQTNRVHISKILDEVNVDYILASSGSEALMVYGTESKLSDFDFYIIDIRMPNMNGNKLVEKLYKITHKPSISMNSGIDMPSYMFNINLHKPIIRKKLLKSLLQLSASSVKAKLEGSPSLEFIPSLTTPKTNNDINLLIAEDNKINQDVISNVLKSLNYHNFVIVPNGLKAYNAYQDNPNKYNIIFLDIRMPVLNGLEATKLILDYYQKNSNIIKHKPKIIGLSANCMVDDKKLCIENGMIDYLTKPIEISAIHDYIEKYSSS